MAQKVQVTLIDDLSGGEADETVTFALDGSFYEIDLSSANAAKLRAGLGPFLGAARRHSGRVAGGRGRRRPAHPSGAPDVAQVRTWAKAAGFTVSQRGRVPQHVLEAYQKATASVCG